VQARRASISDIVVQAEAADAARGALLAEPSFSAAPAPVGTPPPAPAQPAQQQLQMAAMVPPPAVPAVPRRQQRDDTSWRDVVAGVESKPLPPRRADAPFTGRERSRAALPAKAAAQMPPPLPPQPPRSAKLLRPTAPAAPSRSKPTWAEVAAAPPDGKADGSHLRSAMSMSSISFRTTRLVQPPWRGTATAGVSPPAKPADASRRLSRLSGGDVERKDDKAVLL
jgi:hypothetical protein